ncbi:MAG: GntR family transcriptional regulator [Beijerinckiaceae bacterium]
MSGKNARQTLTVMEGGAVADGVETSPAELKLSDRAHNQIKELIVRCELKPGSEVTEASLAERCGLGKAPIRAALTRLTNQGLITPLDRRGYMVTPITMRHVNDLFQLRQFLEPAAAEAAAVTIKDPALVENLRKLSSEQLARLDEVSLTEFLAINREYHVTIANMTRNERLTALMGQLMDEMERLIHLGLAPRIRVGAACKSHIELFNAIKDGEGSRAREIAAAEIEKARQMVIDAIMRDSRLLDLNLAAI